MSVAGLTPQLSTYSEIQRIAMSKQNVIFLMNLAIVLFLMFGFGFVPPFFGLNEMSMKIVGVFAGVIYGWIMLDIGWPSILGLVALCLTGFMPTSDLLASAFGSQTIVMILALLFLAAFVQQAELTEIIVDFLLSRKSTEGKPFLILFNFLFAGFLAAVLSQCLAVLVIFLEIFKEIVRKTGIKPYSTAIPAFMVGMAFSIVIGDISLPFKGCAILGIGAYEAVTGQRMDLAAFSIFMFPLCVASIAFYVLSCKYIFRVDLSALCTYRHEPTKGARVTPLKKISLTAIIISLALLLLPGIIPSGNILADIFQQLGLGGLSLAIIAVLMLLKVNGEPLLDMAKVAGFFPWKVFFVLVVLLPVAGALSSDTVGLKSLLSSLATALLSGLPPALVIFAVVLLPAILTQFANNMIVTSVFVTIICFIGKALPFDPIVLSCLGIISANLSMFFPAANPMNAILFAQRDLVTFRQEAGFGFLSCMLLCMFLAVVGYGWGCIVF